MKSMWMRGTGAAMLALGLATVARGQELKFRTEGEGAFVFDTGAVRGKLVAGPQSHGIISLVDVKTGKELTAGHAEYGVFSFYRLLYTDGRWGHSGWEMPKQGKLTDDGALQISWPSKEEHPVELTAIYRWTKADTLDLEISAKPGKDAPKFEVFLASYFNADSQADVYVKPGLHVRGKPAFAATEVSPVTLGTYLAFPRDRVAAQMFLDGRWDKEPNPVQWSITRYMAGPVAVQRDQKARISTVLMARPEDCFGIDMPYNMTPPDGVAAHHSTYFSLFGKDVKAGETVKARLRLIVGEDLKAEKVLEAYKGFCEK
jgi:hypothetical protein